MLKNMVLTGVLPLGLSPLMIARGLDISFGNSISFTSVVMAVLFTVGGLNLWLSLLIGVLVATLIGFINGLLIEKFDLIPIILTLGTMAILQALALVVANTFAETYSILMLTDQLYYFSTRTFLKIPYPLFVLIVALTGVGMSYHGAKLSLPTLSAVLLGGISLMGGSGSVWGTLIGILIVTVIFNGLSVLNVPSYYIQLFQGLALIIIVAAYEIRNKRALVF